VEVLPLVVPGEGTFREHSGNIQGTFREHSGNIQETFREHSGNIQGTFREHSVRVERTPVSPHSKCKRHLRKVPRLTQNTTCKYEYLRRALTRPNDVSQGTFRKLSEITFGVEKLPLVVPGDITFEEHSRNIQGTFKEHSVNIQ
jgi:hypothetical protein